MCLCPGDSLPGFLSEGEGEGGGGVFAFPWFWFALLGYTKNSILHVN